MEPGRPAVSGAPLQKENHYSWLQKSCPNTYSFFFSFHTHYRWINIKVGRPSSLSPHLHCRSSWWPCGPKYRLCRGKPILWMSPSGQEMRLWRLYYNFGQHMRSNSYHCSKMRISRKQRKAPQCSMERQLSSAPSSFSNGRAERANAQQHPAVPSSSCSSSLL